MKSKYQNIKIKNELKLELLNFKMDLPSDVSRSILLICKISDIKNICLITKSFYSLCLERNLWLDKFKEKNLEMINDEINTVSQYLEEYKKVSYATYTINRLVNMVEINYQKSGCSYDQVCRFNQSFISKDFMNILKENHPFLIKIKGCKNIKKYLGIFITIDEKGSIDYHFHEKNYVEDFVLSQGSQHDKNTIILFITRILYYYPLIEIFDVDNFPLIISKNSLSYNNTSSSYYKSKIDNRKKYWDKCYDEYEKLYF